MTDHAHLRLVPDRSAEDIARAVALIAGVREGHPPTHVERVADLAGAIAAQAGLDDATASRCIVGAWLHDVGMVALPDAVLAPPDPAGSADSPILRAHATLGADLVSRVPELAPAADAIRHHHERHDGSGYPDGLAGEEIPLVARVVATADVVAFLLPSSGADARTRKGAARRLHELAGSALDPALVTAAIDVLADEAQAAGEYLPRTA